ncbi:AraC-type DNA-binding protein [Arthrobacter alpinus]|uniref:AraC-type DNA-binding protein n=1 Tax=Arthrobacter alpinus TaxID=656366 RepID=A0A1H5NCJ9_9MICC|nr:helix-turn-helix domain-containing protein [Arthrobacter alpinus]SEE99265.1 AraC-type DNA-binding protein [Arthrobacter alpinus]
MPSSFKGILYPASLPTFHRLPAPPHLDHLVQWFWIPEWDIEPGRSSRQQLIAFAACNLVVQRERLELAGPTTRLSHQDLTGRGWAVGALLRPAAVPFFTGNPATLRDVKVDLELPELQDAVVHAMEGPAAGMPPESRRENAVAAFSAWLATIITDVSPEALVANSMVELIASNASVVRIEDAAARLSMSTRTLQRLSQKYVGLSPSVLIRRRRLQEAAERTRTQPEADLASIAIEFGYVDQAHLTNDFQKVLGLTPGSYRRSMGQTDK